MTVDPADEELKGSKGSVSTETARHVGYSVAILVYVISIWAVYRLLDWGWPPFLTEEWNDAIPYLVGAIIVSLILTLPLFWFAPPWFRSVKEILTNLAGLAATIAVWRIWPFVFTDGGFPWEAIVRIALFLGVFGPIIAIIAETVKLVRRLAFDNDSDLPPLSAE